MTLPTLLERLELATGPTWPRRAPGSAAAKARREGIKAAQNLGVA